MSFSSLNQHYDNQMCLSIFKKFYQVIVVAHTSLVKQSDQPLHHQITASEETLLNAFSFNQLIKKNCVYLEKF